MFKEINAKLGNMRKAADWTIYPHNDNGNIVIQSDTRICKFDPTTGKGVLSRNVPNGAYFHHLNKFLGAIDVVVPREVIDACIDNQPKSGDKIGGLTIV